MKDVEDKTLILRDRWVILDCRVADGGTYDN